MSSAEELGSNESGWTKYLGSPSQEEGNYSSGVYDDECNFYHTYEVASHRGGGGGKHGNSDDNDSVASDASSGPTHYQAFIARRGRGGCSKFEEQDSYYGRKQLVVEKPSRDVKAKTAREPVVDHKGKKGMSLKHKRGKKTH